MKWFKYISLCAVIVFTSGCSSWLYRMPIPQGNFLEQSDIDKLRVEMTREQVLYVLGQPIAKDAFDESNWYYLYQFNPGRDSEVRKELVVEFEGDKLKALRGDYETPETFNTPLGQ
ncbi:outer membrane protein assembly factor BamE [Pseudoalteromonas spongiae]|uniref:outer membrane protein assembly factor BamE n=1 Tax=Pseudoalteromonas spongiae TaxID=298657 RepID=UPI0037352440